MALHDLHAAKWWPTVRCLADLVIRDGLTMEEDRSYIRDELVRLGHCSNDVLKAMEWVDNASLTGQLHDVLGMLVPASTQTRIQHPIEQASLPPDLWRVLELCRLRGLINPDLYERLVECARRLDTREWGEPEISEFLTDVIQQTTSYIDQAQIRKIVAGERGILLN